MSKGLSFGGFLFFAGAMAITLPILLINPSSIPVDETQFEKLGYHVERTSIGETHWLNYGSKTAVLWVNGCRIEVEWRESRRDTSHQPSGWLITSPMLPSFHGSYVELVSAHELRMRMNNHPCLDKKTPRYVLRAPRPKDPS